MMSFYFIDDDKNICNILKLIFTLFSRWNGHFICDIDNKKEWQHFKLKRCHSVGTA